MPNLIPTIQPPQYNFLAFPESDSANWAVGLPVASPDVALAQAQAEALIRSRDGRWPRGEVLVAVFCIRGQHTERNAIWRLDTAGDTPTLKPPRPQDLLRPKHVDRISLTTA